ncbi:DUF4132 domain-containing protein [Spirillospora sp. NBC_01491]|uniref:DUF4132 domain-containing protein n=1 Tax=Spirillospora sp. NBC_01491 TaxID=2976007 RepID=UPI002E31B605|nr:DUF4132 domain-containing protein [Spirillospora sp. NBC_01491]
MPDTPAAHLVPDAPASALPPLLVEPPWVRRPPRDEPLTIKGLKAPQEPTVVVWAPGEREEWLDEPYRSLDRLPDDTAWSDLAASFAPVSGSDFENDPRLQAEHLGLLMQAPEEYGQAILARWDFRYHSGSTAWLHPLVARHELAALALAKSLAERDGAAAGGLVPFRDAAVIQIMVGIGADGSHLPMLRAWLDRHGLAAVPALVPIAFGRSAPKRKGAEVALRHLVERHGHAAVTEAARCHGDEAADAVAELRIDPLDLYPWPLSESALDPAELPQILLRGRDRALPASATRHFITMLTFTRGGAFYPGVATVTELCDPDSLTEFVWALYEAHRGYPLWAADWMAHALKHLGDEQTVRRLTSVINRWSKADAWRNKGWNALEVHTSVGTDVALRFLHQISQKAADRKRIRPQAEALLNKIAKERGLTSEQLADRLVPDFGLDAEGGMTLDYGPRSFRVGFDEQLKPYVVDDTGKLRKALPKPGAKDDPELAPAAYQRFTALKKDVRTIAADQIARLEAAMVTGRRWTPGDFRAFLVDHPLMWHIARRLVWTADDRPFRIAEDRTFAGVDDQGFDPSPTARIGLPHPYHLGDTVKAWSDVLADYEILQPFPQLGREVHPLTEEERGGHRLGRFEGVTVPIGRVLKLTRLGWERGAPEDNGVATLISRPVGTCWAVVQLDPGIPVGAVDAFPEQRIEDVGVYAAPYWRRSKNSPVLGTLDPVTASELIAELTELTRD